MEPPQSGYPVPLILRIRLPLILLLLFFFFSHGLLPAQPRTPAEPALPGVTEPLLTPAKSRAPEGDRIGGPSYPVRILLSGAERTNKGFLFPSESVLEYVTARGTRSTAWTEVASLVFLKWQGRQTGQSNEWAFVPAETEITLKNGEKILALSEIKALRQIVFQEGRKSVRLYSLFYDYREKDRWTGSGRKEKDYPSLHPAAGTLKAIFISK